VTEPISDQQLAQFAELLKRRQQELRTRLETIERRTEPVTLDQQSVGRLSRMDAIQQQQMAKADAQQVQLLLRRIAAAHARLEEGDYGYCTDCDQAITSARLEVQPETALCLNCQQQQEAQA
jgi:DnaK suppressor protein